MRTAYDGPITFIGHNFARAELYKIRDIAEAFSALSRTEMEVYVYSLSRNFRKQLIEG